MFILRYSLSDVVICIWFTLYLMHSDLYMVLMHCLWLHVYLTLFFVRCSDLYMVHTVSYALSLVACLSYVILCQM